MHVVRYSLCVCVYLAAAGGAAVLGGAPLLPAKSEPVAKTTVSAAGWAGITHTVEATGQVHTHTLVPAGVCVHAALVNV